MVVRVGKPTPSLLLLQLLLLLMMMMLTGWPEG